MFQVLTKSNSRAIDKGCCSIKPRTVQVLQPLSTAKYTIRLPVEIGIGMYKARQALQKQKQDMGTYSSTTRARSTLLTHLTLSMLSDIIMPRCQILHTCYTCAYLHRCWQQAAAFEAVHCAAGAVPVHQTQPTILHHTRPQGAVSAWTPCTPPASCEALLQGPHGQCRGLSWRVQWAEQFAKMQPAQFDRKSS